jgi:hypothetical protein
MKKLPEWILHREPVIFFVFSLLNMYTIFQLGFYYSLDGPQHLYVANIIAELLKGNEEISRYVLINDLIVGYWTGTFLLAIFKLFMPAAMAIKILLAIYYLGIAYAFRYLVRSVHRKPTLVTFLIFPFSATFFIGMGYYNFSLALAVLFLCLGYYIRHIGRFNLKSLLALGLLLILQFLTHAFMYGITGLIMAAYLLFFFFLSWQKYGKAGKGFLLFLKQTGLLFLVSLPANILFVNYVVSIRNITSYMGKQFVPVENLLDGIFNVRMLSWFVREQHAFLNHFIWGILLFLILYSVIGRIRIFMSKDGGKGKKLMASDFWFPATIIILLLYFLYPDKLITGNISLRILTLFFLVLLVWVSSQRYPALVSIAIMLAVIPITVAKRNIHMTKLHELSDISERVIRNTAGMEPNSVYVALNYSSLWTHQHLRCLPGIDIPLIYTNAPQVHGQFPLKINTAECPAFYVGTKGRYSSRIFWSLEGNPEIPVRPVDYVVLINTDKMNDDPEHRIILDELDKYYHQVNDQDETRDRLYELNNRKVLMQKYKEATSLPVLEKMQGAYSPAEYYLQKYVELLNEYCLTDTTGANKEQPDTYY